MKLTPLVTHPTDIAPVYFCPVCATAYASRTEAEQCAVSYPLEQQFPGLQVGDVVTVPSFYTWHNPGQAHWIGKTIPGDPQHKSHFYHHRHYHFYYVVTHIGRDYEIRRPRPFEDNRRTHRGIVSMVTAGMCQPGRYSHVWNTKDGHVGWVRCEEQASLQHLVEEVRSYLGKQSDILL